MSTGPRHQAREAALQILYFCEVSGAAPDEAMPAFFDEHQPDAPDAVKAFAAALVEGAMAGRAELDALIERHATNWRLERIATIDRLILRLAGWELQQHDPDTPAAAVMNEAIELARTFSADESGAFINGVLDAMRKTIEAGA